MIRNFYKALLKRHWFLSVITLVILSKILSGLIAIVIKLAGLSVGTVPIDPSDHSLIGLLKIGYGLLLAPVIETLVFVSLIFWIFEAVRHTCKRPWGAILTSAILFSLAHIFQYGPLYPFIMFPLGLACAFGYHFFKRTRGTGMAIICVSLIHALSNLIAFLITLGG